MPRRGIYDNMRTAAEKARRGKKRDINARFQAMVSHYLATRSSMERAGAHGARAARSGLVR